jgi:hypothetical protein
MKGKKMTYRLLLVVLFLWALGCLYLFLRLDFGKNLGED